MNVRLWVFPAVFCLLISLAFSEGLQMFGLLLCVLWFLRICFLKHRPILLLSILIGGLFSGALFLHQKTNITNFTDKESTFIVYPKATSIQIDGNRLRFDGVLQDGVNEEKIVVQYYMETKAEKNTWLSQPPLSHLKITGQLEEPAEHSNFHQFNYRQYLIRNQTHWQLKAKNIAPINASHLEKPSFHLVEQIRVKIFQYIDRVFTDKIGGYIKTLFFADNRGFSEETLQQYRAIGIIHLFSISGFHITYLTHLIRSFFLKIGLTHERTNLLLILLLPLYGLLAGFGVSVFRAVSQTTMLLVSKVFDKPLDTMDAWALTLLLALFLNPYIIYHISFQLSYTLSGMFILMGKQKWMDELNRLTYSLLFSVMSGIASLPILSYHFYEVPWVSVFANLFFIPFFTHILFPSLFGLFLLSFVLAQTKPFLFLNEGLGLLISSVEQFLTLLNTYFNFSLVTGRLPDIVLFLLVISLFSFLRKLESKQRPRIFSIVCIFISLFYYQLSPMGYVTMLDVGQGESILIKEPFGNKVTLIDTGGRVQWSDREKWEERTEPFSIGADIVVPALKSFGISTIDRLYLTHADADHMGEIESIGKGIRIKEIAGTKTTLQAPNVLKQIKETGLTEFVRIEPVEQTTYPTSDTLIIHPIKQNDSKNNQSLVLYVKIGEDNWLFTGDIEKEAEEQLIRDYPNLRADYLKVAHHGSQTSSTQAFIELVQPQVALISAGKNNTFGHPNQEVLERLANEDITIYSTDKNGAIMHRYLKIPVIDYWLTDSQVVHKVR